MSQVMANEAKAYFEAEAIRAEAREARRFERRFKTREERPAPKPEPPRQS